MMEMIFNCYCNGEVIAKGTAKQLAEILDIPCASTINTYAITKARYHRKYSFEFTGEKISKDGLKEGQVKEKPKPLTKHERDLQWIRNNLIKYGNTSYHNRAEEFKDELERDGIRFRTSPSIFKKGHYLLERI